MDRNAKRSRDDVVETGAREMWRNAEKSKKLTSVAHNPLGLPVRILFVRL